jgi:hypothetical protein
LPSLYGAGSFDAIWSSGSGKREGVSGKREAGEQLWRPCRLLLLLSR